MSPSQATLASLRAQLETLLATLADERARLGALDVAGVLAAADHKQRLLEVLRIPADCKDPSIARLAARVRSAAHANALLLKDVIAALSCRLGVDAGAGLYDARARRYQAPRGYTTARTA